MIKFFGRFVILKNLLFFLIETLFILGVVFLAISVRLAFDIGEIFSYKDLFLRAIPISVICQLCLYYNDLYVVNKDIIGKKLIWKLFQSLGTASVILSILYFIIPSVNVGRGIFFFTMVFIFFILFILRFLYFKAVDLGTFEKPVLIIGSDRLAKMVGEKLHTRKDLGYKVVGFIDDASEKLGKRVVNPRVIGNYHELVKIIQQENVKKVIVALPERRGKLPVNELLKCKMEGINVVDGISFYEEISGKISIKELKPSWMIFSDGFKKPQSLKIMKRIMDLGFSVIGLFFTVPLFF